MKQITLQAILFVALFCVSKNSFAQFENKVSLNVSAAYFGYAAESQGKVENPSSYIYYYDEFYDDITEEFAFSNEEITSGIGLSVGLQYNFSSRFSLEGLFRFTYMNYTSYDYNDYTSYDYVTEEEYNSDPDFYEQYYYFPEYFEHYDGDTYEYTGRSGYYAQEGVAYYAQDNVSTGKGNFFSFDIGLVPKLYLNPRNKFKFYLFTEAHVNIAAGYDISYTDSNILYDIDEEGNFIPLEENSSKSRVSADKDEVDSNVNFGLIPGLGFDLALGKNMSLYFQGGYGVLDSYKDMMMLQGGVRISAFKSKSL